MDLSLLIFVALLVVSFVISIWNAYSSGFSLRLLRNQPGQGFARGAAYAGLGLAFAGMSYVMLIVLSFVALAFGYLGMSDVLYLLAFDFLVFGALIIGLGLVVTAQSIAIAVRRRTFGAIAISAWNIFAEVWDIAIYAEGFRSAYGTLSGGARNRVNVVALGMLAVLLALFIAYAAYRHGVKSAEKVLGPAQAPSPWGRPSFA
jgi:hypothetical protein